jgi:hypothetical protein
MSKQSINVLALQICIRLEFLWLPGSNLCVLWLTRLYFVGKQRHVITTGFPCSTG